VFLVVLSDDLAVDDGIVREPFECHCDRGETLCEVFAVAREQSDLTGRRLHAERAIAVELPFVRPSRSFGQFSIRQRERRLDERQPRRFVTGNFGPRDFSFTSILRSPILSKSGRHSVSEGGALIIRVRDAWL
jgi:hypothetical protein